MNSKKIFSGLPSSAYTDNTFWLKEAKTVFADNWVFVGYKHEFHNLGASRLAGKLNLISADHLMKIEKDDIEIMADSNTIAVLLPGTMLCLNETPQ